jgi:hypothetical protein
MRVREREKKNVVWAIKFYVCVRAIINVPPLLFSSLSFAGAINTENRAKTGTSGRNLLLCPPRSSLLKLSGRRLNFLKTGNENKKWKKRGLSRYILPYFPKKKMPRGKKLFHVHFLSFLFSFQFALLFYILCVM